MQKARNYKILYTEKAKKELSKLSAIDIEHSLKNISYLDLPFPPSLNIRKMTKTVNFYRLKFSKIRIIFELDSSQKTIWIRKIGYRKDIYR